MKAIFLTLILGSALISGCSTIKTAEQGQLYSFTKEERKATGFMLGRNKYTLIEDFRGKESYEEEITALKERIEQYIAGHPDLTELQKSNLRQLKAEKGTTKEEIKLLLGEPDKIWESKNKKDNKISEIWLYRINKIRIFTVFIIPVFPVHESYRLYFQEGVLVNIERHYLEQIIQQQADMGLNTQSQK